MLFNSYSFIFAFLPIALIGYEVAGRFHRRAVVVWLGFISLVFYAWWRPAFLIVLGSSIALNYLAAALISRKIPNNASSRLWLWSAIAANLLALGYFKYLFPFLNLAAHVSGSSAHWSNVLLPLGISFFTFTQIAYLVDLQQGIATFQDISSYVLFVTFFPHVIAGPILHHKQMMPQFQEKRDYRLRLDDLAVGVSWFIMGLGKKVILADTFAHTANLGYDSATPLGFLLAWRGVLAYAMQLYFDFSGYSDMALGLARMFSINFPLNFSSPYKSKSIIEYWQRWHITLSDYINAYLFSPLQFHIMRKRQEQKKDISPRAMMTPDGFVSLVATPVLFSMFIAGMWHGAGVRYIVFGLIHGVYLVVNHAFRMIRRKRAATKAKKGPKVAPVPARWGAWTARLSVLFTFIVVVAAQTFFRGYSCRHALSLLAGMSGLHGIGGRVFPGENTAGLALTSAELLLGFFIIWGLPNTQQILGRFKPALGETIYDAGTLPRHLYWMPQIRWALAIACVFFFAVIHLEDPSTFLYFQF